MRPKNISQHRRQNIFFMFIEDLPEEFPNFTVMSSDDQVYAEIQPLRFTQLAKPGHQLGEADFHWVLRCHD
ncbi:MAG: hypothetical protein R6X27_10875 [Candidatus Desulfacyla sp.]